MKKVLFVGDINVDVLMGDLESLPVVDKEITCKSFDVAVGSSAVICAAAYASLGGDASFLGLAGKDDYGEFMVKSMRFASSPTPLIFFVSRSIATTDGSLRTIPSPLT